MGFCYRQLICPEGSVGVLALVRPCTMERPQANPIPIAKDTYWVKSNKNSKLSEMNLKSFASPQGIARWGKRICNFIRWVKSILPNAYLRFCCFLGGLFCTSSCRFLLPLLVPSYHWIAFKSVTSIDIALNKPFRDHSASFQIPVCWERWKFLIK